MKYVCVLLGLGCLLSAVNAQWLETTIHVGAAPGDLCYGSQENKVYCANEDDDNVTVIDGETNAVLATVADSCLLTSATTLRTIESTARTAEATT
jgi:YVTN family beta-propeller protein